MIDAAIGFPVISQLIEILKKGKPNMAEMLQLVTQLSGNYTELVQENFSLSARIKELEEAAAIKGEINFKDPYWYLEGDDVPHCPRCYSVDKNLVHMINPGKGHAVGRYLCPECRFFSNSP